MRDGFDDFVRSRSTGLLRIAYLLTGDRHSAEDLVQEVLEQMYVKWRRIHSMPEAYDVAAPDHSDHVVVRPGGTGYRSPGTRRWCRPPRGRLRSRPRRDGPSGSPSKVGMTCPGRTPA